MGAGLHVDPKQPVAGGEYWPEEGPASWSLAWPDPHLCLPPPNCIWLFGCDGLSTEEGRGQCYLIACLAQFGKCCLQSDVCTYRMH